MESSIRIVSNIDKTYNAEKTVGSITIACTNKCPNRDWDTSATKVTDEAKNMLRIVEEAVGKGWFPSNTTRIGVVGKANTDKGPKGDISIYEKKRLTVNVHTVKYTAREEFKVDLKNLYLSPHNETGEVNDTTQLRTDIKPYEVTRLAE